VFHVNDQPNTKTLSAEQLWKAWVRPVLVALLVMVFMLIERLQVDWTASCSLQAGGSCEDDVFASFFAWLPAALAYAVFHIWGARHLVPDASPVRRVVGIAVYLVPQLLPQGEPREMLLRNVAIAESEDGFLLSNSAPDAALGLRIQSQSSDMRDRTSWKLIYCRLNLTHVTTAKFSVSQVIPCKADWISEARSLRQQLERDFLAAAAKP
jgi:hypothetical protein